MVKMFKGLWAFIGCEVGYLGQGRSNSTRKQFSRNRFDKQNDYIFKTQIGTPSPTEAL